MSKKKYGNPMVRVPEALIPAVRELSRLYRQGLAEGVVEGLQQLLTALTTGDSTTVGTKLYTPSELTTEIMARLERLEKTVFSPQLTTPDTTTANTKMYTGDSSSETQQLTTGEVREITTVEVAKLMGCSTSTLNLASREGRVPYHSENGWVTEPTGKKDGKASLWRVWRK
jgi:hypothetical protein